MGAALGLSLAIAAVTATSGHGMKPWSVGTQDAPWISGELRDYLIPADGVDAQAHRISMSVMQYLQEVSRALQEYQGFTDAVQPHRSDAHSTAPGARRGRAAAGGRYP